jgi:hypothetical protein
MTTTTQKQQPTMADQPLSLFESDFDVSSSIKSQSLGLDVHAGEFYLCQIPGFIYKTPGSHFSLTVCQILSTNPSKFSLTVNVFESSSFFYFLHKIVLLKSETSCHLEEVYQSSKIETLHVDSIRIPCFVFPQNILEDPAQTPVHVKLVLALKNS